LSIEITGLPAFYDGIIASAEQDLELMDGIVLPIALVLLALLIWSFRLLIIPLATLGVSAATAFTAVYSLTVAGYEIMSAAPSLMASIFVAMNFDYNLFLLTRFKDEITMNQDIVNVEEAVAITIRTAGHTVFVSGCTLIVSLFALVLVKLNLIQSIGIACGLSLFVTLIVTLTLVPALLLAFPSFFSSSCLPKNGCGCCRRRTRSTSRTSHPYKLMDNPEDEDFVYEGTFWYKLAQLTQHRVGGLAIILTITGLVAAISTQAFHPIIARSLILELPRGDPATTAFKELSQDVPPGWQYPYQLVVQAPKGTSVINETFFQTMCDAIEKHLAPNVPNGTGIQGIMYVSTSDPKRVPEGLVAMASQAKGTDYDNAIFRSIRLGVKQFVNHDQSAAIIQIKLSTDPLGDNAALWLPKFRLAVEAAQEMTGYDMALSGFASDVLDTSNLVFSMWPQLIGTVSVAVFLIVSFSLGSAVVAIRGIVTIGYTILFVNGLAKLVYSDGVLDSLGFAGLAAEGGITWLVPPTVFPIICGIALDYDLFLVIRILEFRKNGFSTKESVIRGSASTGTIITAAGVIQGLAFMGLLFSREPILNQLSFYLFISVLFDTFIVRTLLVPAIMGILGRANWWPLKLDPEDEVENLQYSSPMGLYA
jgi:uncharacterized membrane protein YdfJ with MMPL/SSD domain